MDVEKGLKSKIKLRSKIPNVAKVRSHRCFLMGVRASRRFKDRLGIWIVRDMKRKSFAFFWVFIMLLPYAVPFTGETAVARSFSSVNFLEEVIEIRHNNTRVWHLSAQSDPRDVEQIHVTYLVGPIDLSVEVIEKNPKPLPVFELYFLSYNFDDNEITQQGIVAASVFPFEYELHVVQGGELDGFIYISYIRFNEDFSADVVNYNPVVEIAWTQDGEAWQTRRVGNVEYTQNGTLTITEDERGVSQLADVTKNGSLVDFSDIKISTPDSFVSGSGVAYTTWSSQRSAKAGEDSPITSTFLSETNLLEDSVDFKLLDIQGNDFDNNESVSITFRTYSISTIAPLPDNEILVSTVIANLARRRTQITVHKISLNGLAEEVNGTALSEKSLLGRWPVIVTETRAPIIRAPVVITDEGYNVVFSASGNQGVKLLHLPSSLTSDYSAEWTEVKLEEKLRITIDHIHAIAEEDGSVSAAWSVYSTLAQPFSSFGFISNYDQQNMVPVTGTFVNETLGIYRTGFTLFSASEVNDSATGLIWIETIESEEGQYNTVLKYDYSLQERESGRNVVWAFLLGITLCISAFVAAVIVIRLKT